MLLPPGSFIAEVSDKVASKGFSLVSYLPDVHLYGNFVLSLSMNGGRKKKDGIHRG